MIEGNCLKCGLAAKLVKVAYMRENGWVCSTCHFAESGDLPLSHAAAQTRISALQDELSCMRKHVALLLEAGKALMAERRALRSVAVAFGMPENVSDKNAEEFPVLKEYLRLKAVALRACESAGLWLENDGEA